MNIHFIAFLYFVISLCFLAFFASRRLKLHLKTILSTFLLGLLFAPLAGFSTFLLETTFPAQTNLEPGIKEFFIQFFLVGPLEEISKFFAVFVAAHRKADFSNAYDGILLAIVAALGFAGIENVLYLYAFGFDVTIPRLLLGNLGHATYSIFWGYALGVVMHEGAPFSTLGFGLLLASLLHGAYNFFLSFSLIGAVISLSISGFLIYFMIKFLRSEKERQTN